MKIVNENIDLDGYFDRLIIATNRLLLIDYDGTVAPFRVERNKAGFYPGVRDALELILARNCRTVIVTGRSIKDLTALLDLEHVPEMWGCHGWERMLPDGTYIPPVLDDAVVKGLAEAARFVESENLAGRREEKPAGIALHWRGLDADSIDRLRKNVGAAWKSIAGSSGLRIHEFDGGLELRPDGRNKGDAVRLLLDDAAPGTVTAYMGDDATDEDAFRAIRSRGLGILVNSRLRRTEADLWLQPPDELLWFLHRWADACKE
jgi:trehalose 6-phosphate phosphatase